MRSFIDFVTESSDGNQNHKNWHENGAHQLAKDVGGHVNSPKNHMTIRHGDAHHDAFSQNPSNPDRGVPHTKSWDRGKSKSVHGVKISKGSRVVHTDHGVYAHHPKHGFIYARHDDVEHH